MQESTRELYPSPHLRKREKVPIMPHPTHLNPHPTTAPQCTLSAAHHDERRGCEEGEGVVRRAIFSLVSTLRLLQEVCSHLMPDTELEYVVVATTGVPLLAE